MTLQEVYKQQDEKKAKKFCILVISAALLAIPTFSTPPVEFIQGDRSGIVFNVISIFCFIVALRSVFGFLLNMKRYSEVPDILKTLAIAGSIILIVNTACTFIPGIPSVRAINLNFSIGIG